MPEFIFQSLVAGLSSLLAGAGFGWLAESKMFRRWLRRIMRLPEAAPKSYSERLSELTASLSKASAEVDSVLAELSRVAKERGDAVQRLETDLATLESREREIKERIETLQKTPIAVAEHFAKLLEPSERRSARRDFILFGAGAVVTTVIAVVIALVKK